MTPAGVGLCDLGADALRIQALGHLVDDQLHPGYVELPGHVDCDLRALVVLLVRSQHDQ